jgi:ATP-dependent DNA helicase RecG
MAITLITISPEQAGLVLRKEEGQFCDMKAKEITPRKLSRTLSAFANADGGEAFIGIDDQKGKSFAWQGFQTMEDANAHLQVVEELFPIGTLARCEFLTCSANVGFVLHIEIDKTSDIRNASDGIAYLRRGAQNLPQDTSDKLERA